MGESPVRYAIAAGLMAVAAVGWIDDYRPMSFKPRLAVHVGTGIVIAWAATRVNVGVGIPLHGAIVFTWWAFWTVSSINVINFMDGIDGIIGLQVAVYAVFTMRADSSPDGFAASVSDVACRSYGPGAGAAAPDRTRHLRDIRRRGFCKRTLTEARPRMGQRWSRGC